MNIENQIIQYLKQNKEGSSTNILEGIDSDKSLATLKRILTSLINGK